MKSLPNNIQTVRFGDVARQITESVSDPVEAGFERYVGLEHLDPELIRIRRWGLLAENGTTFTRVFREGQVLFGRRRAYQRKAAIADFDGVCSGDIIVMEAKTDKLLPELLPFIVQTEGFYEHALSTSAGSLSPRTKWSALAQYEFPLPPLDEQRRIAEILWAVEDVAKSTSRVKNEALRLKSAFFEDAFTSKSNSKLDGAQINQLLRSIADAKHADLEPLNRSKVFQTCQVGGFGQKQKTYVILLQRGLHREKTDFLLTKVTYPMSRFIT